MFVVGGESLVDLVSQPPVEGGEYVMHAHAGGSPYNCAIALSKLGNDAGFLCPLSKDGFGDFMAQPLIDAGVSILLHERVFEPTTLAVVTLNERGQAQYEFYRGAERALNTDALIAALPESLDVYQIGGFCAIEEEDAAIWLKVVEEAIKRDAMISIDPNVRPTLVSDFQAYKARVEQFLDLAHVIKMSTEDMEAFAPGVAIDTQVASLLKRPNCKMVVVTDGEYGSRAFTATASASQGVYTPPVFGDTVGAGDSLMAGILNFMIERNWHRGGDTPDDAKLEEMLRFGAVVAGLNCGHKGCNPPTRAEVDAIISA